MKVILDFEQGFWEAISKAAAELGLPAELFIQNRLIGLISREAAYLAVFGEAPSLALADFTRDTDGNILGGDRLFQTLFQIYHSLYSKQAAQAEPKTDQMWN